MIGAVSLVLLTACSSAPKDSTAEINPADPNARAFTGTIISLRPFTSTMMISKDEHVGHDAFPNEVLVKYDANTQFLLDNQPTTIDHVGQYMTVHVSGHMRDGQMFAEIANFSSVLPQNVRPAPATAPAR
jgi:predicted MPP superfamily phosphohydrolase